MYYLNILYCNVLSEDSCPASAVSCQLLTFDTPDYNVDDRLDGWRVAFIPSFSSTRVSLVILSLFLLFL